MANKSHVDRNLQAFAILDFIIGSAALFISYYNVYINNSMGLVWLDTLVGIGFWLGGIGFLLRKDWSKALHYTLGLLLLIGLLLGSTSSIIPILYLILLIKFLSDPKLKQALS